MSKRKSKKSEPNAFCQWLDTFVSEKGIDIEQVIEVEGPNWGTNSIPVGVVIEHMKITTDAEQAQIKDILVKIDFRNGDVMHFIKHLAKAIAK